MRAHPVPRLRPDPFPPRSLMVALAGLLVAIPALAQDGPLPPKPARTVDLHARPLALPEGTSLHGRLTDRRGKALVDWVVEARRPWSESAEARVRSDRQGRYAFGSLDAGPMLLTLLPAKAAGAPTGPLPVALFREGEADGRAAARRVDIGGLDTAGLEAWRPNAKPEARSVSLFTLPAACRDLAGGRQLVAHDRQRAWRIDEQGRVTEAVASGIDQELVAALPAGPGDADLLLLTQNAWRSTLSYRDSRNQVRWVRQTRGRGLLLASGEAGRVWWQTLDGNRHAAHVLDAQGACPLAVQLPAHAPAAGLATPDGARLPAGAIGLASVGEASWELDLPTPPTRLLPAGNGSCWALGGAVATRLSRTGTIEARWLLPRPANQATTDSKGRLWLEVGERIVRLDRRSGTSLVLAGRGKPAISAMACSAEHLWLLGRDRRTLARLPLE